MCHVCATSEFVDSHSQLIVCPIGVIPVPDLKIQQRLVLVLQHNHSWLSISGIRELLKHLCINISLLTDILYHLYHRAHAAAAPWEGQNALDAAVLAYNSISLLRQQIKPNCRVHGIIEGRDWAANSKFNLIYVFLSWICFTYFICQLFRTMLE